MSDLINRQEAIDRLSEVLTNETDFELAKRAIMEAPVSYDLIEVAETVCDELCQYINTADENYICDYMREHNEKCPLNYLF